MIEVGEWRLERDRMVEEQIISRGVRDPRVLEAMRKVPRHLFVEKNYQHQAYSDYPLPIGHGQTISQPYMVAVMTELLALTGKESVLELGTGSGYQTAVLGLLCSRVFTIERIAALGSGARRRLEELGFQNVFFVTGDGSVGWPDYAPYAGIIVTAGAPDIPKPLLEQLADGGRLVIPVGNEMEQTLNVVYRQRGNYIRKEMLECSFVPLVGKESWHQ